MSLFKRKRHEGWVDDPAAKAEFRRRIKPFFRQHASAVQGSGQGVQVVLWKFFEQVTGQKFRARDQDLGDCVGQASGLGVDVLTAVQIAMLGMTQKWMGPVSTEYLYAASRVEIAGGRLRGDGSNGSWVVRAMLELGTLLRGKYGNIDLTKYRPDLAKLWGAPGNGVPDELEPIGRQHIVKNATLVEAWPEACDAVSNGFPVLICSSPGYTMRADSEGFVSRAWKRMNHAWLLWGIDTLSKRQGGALCTSWGPNSVRGPAHPLGSPEGVLWVDAKNIDAMLAQGDSYALSNFDGYPYQQDTLRYKLF